MATNACVAMNLWALIANLMWPIARHQPVSNINHAGAAQRGSGTFNV